MTSLLRKQVTSWSRGTVFTTREGHLGDSACYTKTSPLLPGTHCGCPDSVSAQVNTSERGLHREDCQMGHDSRSFWYQVYALYLCKSLGPRRPSSRVRWISWRSRCKAAWHGWKIGWPNLHTIPLTLESICRWSSKPAGMRSGAVLVSPKKITIEKSLRLGFSTTNNEAEYETLLMRMAMVQKMGGKTVEMFSDSRLVVG